MKIALDIGNSAIKGSILDNNNKYVAPLDQPSAVFTVEDSKYMMFHDPSDYYIQVLESPLKHYDYPTAIGHVALDRPGYEEFDVSSTTYKSNHEITTALLFGSITPHIDGDTDAKLAVSVPIVEAKTLGLIAEYQTLLTGTHKIRIFRPTGTFDCNVTFSAVRVFNEGQAGFFGLLDTRDTNFQLEMSTVYQSLGEESSPIGDLEDFLIVDIGEGTTDLAVFRNKKFNPEFSYSITSGYGNLLEDAIKNAQRNHLTIESRKELQKVLSSTNKRRQARKEKWASYVNPTKERFIKLVTDTILNAYGTKDYFDAIIFLGGGFSALTGYTTDFGQVSMEDDQLFTTLKSKLESNHKDVDLIFGVPRPFSGRINERGLVQVLTTM